MPILRSFSPGNLVSYLSGASVPNPLKTVALYDKGGAVFNVMAYGAKGDGTTDDTAALQAAATAATTVAGTVLFPPGTYGVSTSLSIGSSVTVKGAAKGAVIKALPSFSGSALLVNANASDSAITIDSIKFDGNKAVIGGTAHNIRLSNITNLTVRDMVTVNAGSHGIWVLGGGADLVFTNIDATDCNQAGIMVSASYGSVYDGVTVTNVRAYRNGRSGIDMGSNGGSVWIMGCKAVSNTTYGIYADGGETPLDQDAVITENFVTGSVYGIAATDTVRAQVTDNHVSSCTVGVQSVNSSDIIIIANHIHDCGQYALNFDNSGPYLANPPAGTARDSNPTLYRTRDLAKSPYMAAARVSVRNNILRNNGQTVASDAIRVKNGTDFRFAGNDVRDTQTNPTQTTPLNAFLDTAPTFAAWGSGTSYTAGALVSNGGSNYQALTTHTSDATTQPGSGANWQTAWVRSGIQPWANSTVYGVGTWVTNGGSTYASKTAHTADTVTTQPGTGSSWQTYWTLQAPVLDGFNFIDEVYAGHSVSNSLNYLGTNHTLFGVRGMQGRTNEQHKFLNDVYVGANWKLNPVDASSVINIGISTYTNNFQGPINTNAGSDLPITLKRSATATSGATVQRSSRLQLEASLWNTGTTSANSKAPKIAASGTDPNNYWLEMQDDTGATLFKFQNNGLLTLKDGGNIAAGTTTGTQIGTATSQKLGFFGKTPIVQPTGGAATAAATYSTNEQTMLNAVYTALRNLGLIS